MDIYYLCCSDVYEVGVHIADVGYFVREGTHVDRAAKQRATSVYLEEIKQVYPMLPKKLRQLCRWILQMCQK